MRTGMVVVVFRSRLRESPAGYSEQAQRMLELARRMPGFISFKAFTSEDGERLTLHEWESLEHLRAWREHPEHRAAQKAGRERYYEEYQLQVLEPVRTARFTRE
jgi:heme-degrading monooxygenase HmoA